MLIITLLGEPKSTQKIYGQYCLGKRPVRFMTDEGKALKEDYQWQAKVQWGQNTPLLGSICLQATFYFKTRAKRRDLDNFNKILLDALSGIAYADDSQIDQLTLIRNYDKDKPRVEVEITSLTK